MIYKEKEKSEVNLLSEIRKSKINYSDIVKLKNEMNNCDWKYLI